MGRAAADAVEPARDPEDVRELQGELFELVNAQVERFGGTTEKFVGDAVLAVFGIPRTHEDDPERAVRAALSAQEEFRSFAESVRERFGSEVSLRVGVNTGEVVAGREAAARGELMVSGDAVNVAARLQQAAEPGSVLVGERTHAATRRSISYADVRSTAAKGKSEPLAAWIALGGCGSSLRGARVDDPPALTRSLRRRGGHTEAARGVAAVRDRARARAGDDPGNRGHPLGLRPAARPAGAPRRRARRQRRAPGL